MKRRRLMTGAGTVVALAAVVAFLVTSPFAASPEIPAAADRPRTADDQFPRRAEGVARSLGIETSASRRVARDTFLVPREGGELCVVTVTDYQMPFVCNPRNDFFGPKHVVFNIVENGGTPAAAQDVLVVGLAKRSVGGITLAFPDGRVVELTLTSDAGFAYRTTGARPKTISVVGRDGNVLEEHRIPVN